jgi:hypothetical protein
MLVKFTKLPSGQLDPWIRLKCFYDQDGKYGEFYLSIHPAKKLILIQSKEGYFSGVLTQAFAKAMQEL